MVIDRVVGQLAPDDLAGVPCDSVLIRVPQGMVPQWLEIGIIRMFRRMHCNLIVALIAIILIAKVDWGVNGVRWFLIDHKW